MGRVSEGRENRTCLRAFIDEPLEDAQDFTWVSLGRPVRCEDDRSYP